MPNDTAEKIFADFFFKLEPISTYENETRPALPLYYLNTKVDNLKILLLHTEKIAYSKKKVYY